MELKADKFSFPIVVVMGPTASGKSGVALNLAGRIPSEIVSVDSMQCYKMMDIGTAKPTHEDMLKIPHHLINVFDIGNRVDVYSYVELMKQAVKDIAAKGKVAIVVGGTGLYIKAFLYGLDTLPSDEGLRKSLYDDYEHNVEKLKRDLCVIDPAAASLFSEKPRKMIRALEVYKLTGKSILEQNQSWSGHVKYSVLSYKLKWERQELYRRISERVEGMLKNGWIEETKSLEEMGFLSSPTAKQAIGYILISKYLEGSISYEEMWMRIIASTKKYARRQETWFNNQHPEASEVVMPQSEDIIANRIITDINSYPVNTESFCTKLFK